MSFDAAAADRADFAACGAEIGAHHEKPVHALRLRAEQFGAAPLGKGGERRMRRAGDEIDPAVAHRPIGGHQRHLKRILGRFTALEHVHAEREQSSRVPVVDLLERGVDPGANGDDQILIGVIDDRSGRRVATLRAATLFERRVATLFDDFGDFGDGPHERSLSNLTPRIQSGCRSSGERSLQRPSSGFVAGSARGLPCPVSPGGLPA